MNSFDFLGFNRSEIEKTLGLNLHDNLLEYNIGLKKNLDSWLVPYLSRDNILLSDAACLIIGANPRLSLRGEQNNECEAYKESLWDAIDNGKLSAKDILHYDNMDQDRRDCVKNGLLSMSSIGLYLYSNHRYSKIPIRCILTSGESSLVKIQHL